MALVRSNQILGDEKRSTGASLASLLKFRFPFPNFLQEPDLRYLVENIWNSQSVLSAHEDLFDLVLVRWNKYEEWSPWNCILLTKEEASAHAKLENVTEVLVFLPLSDLQRRPLTTTTPG